MALRIDSDSRVQLLVTNLVVPATVNPEGATVQVEIDDVRYPCSWVGDAEEAEEPGHWTRQARTDDWFAGPSVPADEVAGAVVLSYGLHQSKLIVSDGSAIVPLGQPRFRIER